MIEFHKKCSDSSWCDLILEFHNIIRSFFNLGLVVIVEWKVCFFSPFTIIFNQAEKKLLFFRNFILFGLCSISIAIVSSFSCQILWRKWRDYLGFGRSEGRSHWSHFLAGWNETLRIGNGGPDGGCSGLGSLQSFTGFLVSLTVLQILQALCHVLAEFTPSSDAQPSLEAMSMSLFRRQDLQINIAENLSWKPIWCTAAHLCRTVFWRKKKALNLVIKNSKQVFLLCFLTKLLHDLKVYRISIPKIVTILTLSFW